MVAFLDRSPLYLVGFSALGEPPAVLRMQLSLVHGQLVSLLTGSALASLFRRSPGYDLRKLLGGWVGTLGVCNTVCGGVQGCLQCLTTSAGGVHNDGWVGGAHVVGWAGGTLKEAL